MLVVIIAAFSAPYLLPKPLQKSAIERVLAFVLGADVDVAGISSFSILPSLKIIVSDVHISANPIHVKISKFEIDIETVALLSNQISIDKLHIDSPKISISEGLKSNFVMARVNPDQNWGWWPGMSIRDAQITRGQIAFKGSVKGRKINAQNINLQVVRLDVAGSDGGISVKGSADVNGELVEINLDMGDVSRLIGGGRLAMAGSLKSAHGQMKYEGAIAKRQYLVGDGRFVLEAPNITHLEKWIGKIFDSPVKGMLKITGAIDVNGTRIALNDLSFNAGKTHIQGDILFQPNSLSSVGRIEAKLVSNHFDLAPYVSMISVPEWSHSISGQIDLQWVELALRSTTSGPGAATITLKQNPRRIDVRIEKSQLFGGVGQGHLQLSEAEGMMFLKTEIELNRFEPEILLENIGGVAALSGKGDLYLKLFSVGSNLDQMIAALSGDGHFNFLSGRLYNQSLADYLLKDRLGNLAFNQLIGSFSINNGIIAGSDFLFKAPELSLVGRGAVDLVRGGVEMQLQSVVLDTTNKRVDTRSIHPFRIQGRLNNLEFYAD